MTPAARIESAITLLSLIEAGSEPPDRAANRFFRERRFIGSKDRRAVGDLVYQVLRSRARLDWWCGHRAREAAHNEDPAREAAHNEDPAREAAHSEDPAREAGEDPTREATRGEDQADEAAHGEDQADKAAHDKYQAVSRRRVIAALTIEHGAAAAAALFDGSTYGPAPLDRAELDLVQALDGQPLDHAEQTDWVRAELPQWLLPLLRASLGAGLAQELAALGRPAPLDLRVNSLKGDREAARQALAAEGIEAAPMQFSPLGLRVAGRHRLPAVAAYRDGLVEVQDEGSQVVALLCDARPGLTVADLCAGAGGKTLALAAAMQGFGEERGRLVALDIDAARLERARPRLARAGLMGAGLTRAGLTGAGLTGAGLAEVEIRAISEEDDGWLEGQAGVFDRVLVDAPCSGSGAWRRDPAARWRLTPTDLGRYRDLQRRVLTLAAPLVKPAGRLIYATCSLLAGENQEQLAAFLERHGDFRPLALAPLWAAVGLGGPCPAAGAARAGELLLTPARHGTDGFYVAVLERARPAA